LLKIFLVVVVALTALIVIVVVAGWCLPKSHVVSRSITLRQRPGTVFELISNFPASPSWRSDVKRVEMLPAENGRIRFCEAGNNGTITYEVVESQPAQRLVTQIADKSLPFGGTWIFELQPTADGCRLTITENGEVYNPVFRFVSRFVLGQTRTIDNYLSDLAHKFGETQPIS